MTVPPEPTTPKFTVHSTVPLPSHVLAVESLRTRPFCRMFGCREFETVAKLAVQFLSDHGDLWDVVIPFDDMCESWDLSHYHDDCGNHVFRPTFAVDGIVTDEFVRYVTRQPPLNCE